MAKVLVLYHSMYGHIETMANKVAEGARSVPGTEVVIKRVPETMSPDAFAAAGGKTDQIATEAMPSELADFDAIIFGTPTRFGNMASQMRSFLDQTGALWKEGALIGKITFWPGVSTALPAISPMVRPSTVRSLTCSRFAETSSRKTRAIPPAL